MARKIILNENDMALVQERLAAQIIERHPEMDDLILVGIQRRGADFAKRLAESIESKLGAKVKSGTLDINLYRDDWTCLAGGAPHVGSSSMPFSVDNMLVLLVDDVLFSGRTIRSALEAIMDYGRPKKIELLAFIDRGHRELPICADYVGRKIGTEKSQHIDVLFRERDGEDMVCLSE